MRPADWAAAQKGLQEPGPDQGRGQEGGGQADAPIPACRAAPACLPSPIYSQCCWSTAIEQD